MNPSSSTTKPPLLITAGCSWTDAMSSCYIKNNITAWPSIIAKFMDWDLINVGLGGAGVGQIFNSTIDAIIKNKDREIIVFVFWSQTHRLNLFDASHLTFNIFDPIKEDDMTEHIIKDKIQAITRKLMKQVLMQPGNTERLLFNQMANYGLRYIWLLNEFCKERNIKIVHDCALNPIIGIDWVLHNKVDMDRQRKYMAECENNWYWQEIKKWKNQIGDILDPESSGFNRYRDYYITRKEKHPNQQGQMLIAHNFINEYMKIYPTKTETSTPSFVYD